MPDESIDTTEIVKDAEPTPEQKAEILGEEPGEKDTPSDDEPKDKKAKPDLKVVGKPDKETPPATFPKSQEELDRVIMDRVTRERGTLEGELRQIRESNQRLQEIVNSIASDKIKRPDQPPPIPQSPDEVHDITAYLNDPAYKGWTMEALKKEHPDHYEHIKTRILNKMDVDKRFQDQEQRRHQESENARSAEALKPKLQKVQELLGAEASKYFYSDGTFNEAFMKDVVQWGAQQGILDPLLAFQLKGKDGSQRVHHFTETELQEYNKSILEKAKKALVKQTEDGEPPPRVSSSGHKGSVPVSAETDTKALKQIYVDKKKGWQKARELLVERGELSD